MTCDVYARKNFNANVVLSGGTNMFVGFLGTGDVELSLSKWIRGAAENVLWE